MNVLDLFAGIGGFSLGFERAGMRTVAFCESDPFCRRVLARHWPRVPIFDDVRELGGDALRSVGDVDLVAAGFPCQDISRAGRAGRGIAGERSGLWAECARIVGELRPRYVVVENVAMLLGRGHGVVLGDLAALGFDAEWHCIPAAAVGARHLRDRVWIVAHAAGGGLALGGRVFARGEVADAATAAFGQWHDLPDVVRAAHGIPCRVDRVRSLGNAAVPQITELIGRAIMSRERAL